MADNEEVGERLIVFQDRVVEKKTMCANCVSYDADATRVMEEWRPIRDADVNRIRGLVQFTGLQLAGFDRADVGLKVAQLTRRGLSVEAAVQEVEKEQLLEAYKRVPPGHEPLEADLRYRLIAQTEKDIHSGKLGRCRGGGQKDNGDPVGFLVMSAYHCHRWSGRPGWSVAHGGAALDPLPEELVARADEKAKPVSK